MRYAHSLPARLVRRTLGLYVPLALAVVYILFPVYWTVNTSLARQQDLFSDEGVQYYPKRPTFENYISVWRDSNLGRFFVNSAIVAGLSCTLLVFTSSLAGYAFAKFQFRGKIAIMIAFLGTQMFPGVLLVIPLFATLSSMGLKDNYVALILPYAAFATPFSTILMRGFFMGVPNELEESAMIDGCSRFGAFWRISLPLALPGIVATGIFAFIGSWNELLLAVLLIDDPEMKTLPAGLRELIGAFEINWGCLTAAAVIALLPAMLLFGYVQRYLVKGLASGGVKA